MKDIIRILIKGSSGYGCSDEAYTDKVTIAPDMIAYEYCPYIESDMNPVRKWKYKTNSPIFQMVYKEIIERLPSALKCDPEAMCTDIGGIEFVITYADKSKEKYTFWMPGDYFIDLFRIIKRLVPETEYTPAVLLTEDDYNEQSEDL